jgi:hypothetical protein
MWPVKQNVTRCDQVTKLVLYLYQFTKMWTVIQNVTRFDPCHKIGIGCETVDQNVTNQTKYYQSNNKEIELDGVDQNVTSSYDQVNKIVIRYKLVNQNVTKWQNWDKIRKQPTYSRCDQGKQDNCNVKLLCKQATKLVLHELTWIDMNLHEWHKLTWHECAEIDSISWPCNESRRHSRGTYLFL